MPCHNDLLAANFLNDGTRIHIVDWECAGGWATATSTSATSPSTTSSTREERALVEGLPRRAGRARRYATLRLMRFMSDFREAMWGVVQSGISELDFDFQGYGAKHFGRLQRAGADPALRTVAQGRRMARREQPDSARCVIIGGGVGGTSIAYHLGQLGWDDVVLLERNQLTSGSTFHSAGLVGQLRGSVSLTKMMMYSVDLYRRLGEESEFDPGWAECGGIRLASSKARDG